MNQKDAFVANAGKLLRVLKEHQAELVKLQNGLSWLEEDGVYRFYHQSFKVYYLQEGTRKITELFKKILPEHELNSWFLQLVKEGTKKSLI